MKKNKILLLLFLITQLKTYSQDIDSRIDEIRKMYLQITSEKTLYTTKEKDITWKAFSGDDDTYSKATATSYFNFNKELKLIILNYSSYGQMSMFEAEDELYYQNNKLYFIYSINNNIHWKEVYEQKGKTYSITEERIYFGADGRCIRYLYRKLEEKPEKIDSLRNITPNRELDCSYSKDLVKRIENYLKD